jgi:peptidoglycan/xylan/chitin deacetylase (PgdA/CDA1 family)
MSMRLDRTLSLNLVRPLMRMGIPSSRRALPILMYHAISDDPEPGVSAYYRTNTSPARFEQHLRCLNDRGFRSASLNEAARMLHQGLAKEGKIIAITFDDGFRDFYDAAYPLLKKYGHVATVYLPTGFIGEQRRSFKNKECLTWQEVRESHAQGIQFGSHTANHPVLYELSWKKIEDELAASKMQIEQVLGEKITGFAYPYAFPQQDRHFTEKFVQLLRRQGYQNSVTTMIGRASPDDDLFRLKRLPVNSDDDVELFAAKLDGAYDWLAHPQGWFKSVRHYRGGAGRREFDLPAAPLTAPGNSPL